MVNLNIIFESTGIENEPSKALFRAVIDNVASLTELGMMGGQCAEVTSREVTARKDPADGESSLFKKYTWGDTFPYYLLE